MTPHKHAGLIKAWADGATIEWKLQHQTEWSVVACPTWHEGYEYRIKPAKRDIETFETHMYWGSDYVRPLFTSDYPPNVRFTFEGGWLINVELLRGR